MAVIRIGTENGKVFTYFEHTGRVGVYLDNDSLIDVAKTPDRASRFLAVANSKATLMFSVMNAIDLAGPTGATAETVRDFLNGVGANWVPLRLRPWDVITRERGGMGPSAVFSEEFFTGYLQDRMYELSPGGGALIDMSADSFFQLGSVVDWIQERRDSTIAQHDVLKHEVGRYVADLRARAGQAGASVDTLIPQPGFHASRPMSYVWPAFGRVLAQQAKSHTWMPNDAGDLLHASVALASSSLILLDKHWKPRAQEVADGMLPGFVRVFYREELDLFLDVLESAVVE